MTKKPEEKQSRHFAYRSPELKNHPIFDDEDDLFERLKSMGTIMASLTKSHVLRLINNFNNEYHKHLHPELANEFYENIGDPIMLYRSEKVEERPPKKISIELESYVYKCMERDSFDPDLSRVFYDKYEHSIIFNRVSLIELSNGRLVSVNAILDESGRCYCFRFLPVFEKGFFDQYKESCLKYKDIEYAEGITERRKYYSYNLPSIKAALEENEARLMAERRGEMNTQEALQTTKSSRRLLARLFRRK